MADPHMQKKLVNPWVLALLSVGLYGTLFFITLLYLNPRGNNLNWIEWAINTVAGSISVGILYFLYRYRRTFGWREPASSKNYLLLFLISLPLFWLIYSFYWAFLVREFLFGMGTSIRMFPFQLLVNTVFFHLPISLIVFFSLHNAQVHTMHTKLLESERLMAESRFNSLQQQVNPHFLFNSLNILSALIRKDAQRAEVFTQKLSELYRFYLKHGAEPVVSLQDELALQADYMYLMENRFGASFRLDTSALCNVSQHAHYLIPGTLQLLTENVVKHNSATKEAPVVIKLFMENGCITVSNNIQKKNVPLSGFGLKNLSDRYHLLTGKVIEVWQKDEVFYVSVPLIKQLTTACEY